MKRSLPVTILTAIVLLGCTSTKTDTETVYLDGRTAFPRKTPVDYGREKPLRQELADPSIVRPEQQMNQPNPNISSLARPFLPNQLAPPQAIEELPRHVNPNTAQINLFSGNQRPDPNLVIRPSRETNLNPLGSGSESGIIITAAISSPEIAPPKPPLPSSPQENQAAREPARPKPDPQPEPPQPAPAPQTAKPSTTAPSRAAPERAAPSPAERKTPAPAPTPPSTRAAPATPQTSNPPSSNPPKTNPQRTSPPLLNPNYEVTESDSPEIKVHIDRRKPPAPREGFRAASADALATHKKTSLISRGQPTHYTVDGIDTEFYGWPPATPNTVKTTWSERATNAPGIKMFQSLPRDRYIVIGHIFVPKVRYKQAAYKMAASAARSLGADAIMPATERDIEVGMVSGVQPAPQDDTTTYVWVLRKTP